MMRTSAAIAALGALMLSCSSAADAKLLEVETRHVRPRLEVGERGCLKKAEKGDLVRGV